MGAKGFYSPVQKAEDVTGVALNEFILTGLA